MSKLYEFAPFLTAPAVRKQAAPYGSPQIIHIPPTHIPSPLAPNLAPQTLKELKEYLTGCGPDGKPKPGCEKGVEIWEAWKRAWDLWNNHYIEGRVDPTYIMAEYNRLKRLMDDDNERKRRRQRFGGADNSRGNRLTPVQYVYSRVYSKTQPPPPPAGRIWIRNRNRTKTVQEPTGRTVQRNNPNPPTTQRLVTRRVRKLVQQRAGEIEAIFKKVPRDQQGLETRIIRANGPWNPNLTSWAAVRRQRLFGNLATPQDTETTPESMEPTGTITVQRPVNTTPKHLEYVDLTVSETPHPLMSWADLAAARKTQSGIPPSKGSQQEEVYESSRPQIWVSDDYDLVDTAKTEVLLDDRTTEIDVIETVMQIVPGDPIETVPVMRDVTVWQWLEVGDPSMPPTVSPIGSRRQSQDQGSNNGGQDPPVPPPIIPRSYPLDSHINGTRDTPTYSEWERNLPARWDAVNPRRLSSTNDPEYIKWRDTRIQEVKEQWGLWSRPGACFQGLTHSNGYSAIEDHAHLRDEDMADVSDQEFQDTFDEDEDMEDVYEQRGMGAESTDPVPEDVESGEDDFVDAVEGDGVSDSEPPKEPETPIDLGPLPKGPNGGAAGFLPLKFLPEFREPDPDANGDFPDDWTDNIQNTVWRPRRVGEKSLRVDLDEPWENITDLEVDGGLDCGRSPYPLLRQVNKYIRNEFREDPAHDPSITFRKERIWDGVTGSLFNMPTRPDEPETKKPDDHEAQIQALYKELDLNERPRHDLFPLDIRRVKRIDPETNRPFESEIKIPLLDNETEVDFDLPWSNPIREYPKLKETDPWWVTSEQEKLRDVPPRRHPPADNGHAGDKILLLDDYRWKQERLLDQNNQANYFVTNLHGATILINGTEVKLGCIAGPLPSFAVIQTPGGQVSFWWGPGGRNWGSKPVSANVGISWRQLRRMPGWELVGLNAGFVWNRKIRDRLDRERSGNDEEDDEQWEEWKNYTATTPTVNDGGNTGSASEGRNTGSNNNDPPAKRVHPEVETCYVGKISPASSLNAFRPPDRFETDEVELEWLHTRAQPLRESIVGAASAHQQQVQELKALSNLIGPDPDTFWPGANSPELPEITAQRQKATEWVARKAQILRDQQAVNVRVTNRRNAEEAAKNKAYMNSYQAATNKRRLLQDERDDQTRRTRRKLEQDIRNAQTNFTQGKANFAAAKQAQANKEHHEKRVKEEAAALSRIIGLNIARPSLAQLNSAADTRKIQRLQNTQDKVTKLANVNATRARQGKQAISLLQQESQAVFDSILQDAVQFHILNSAQAAIAATAAQGAKAAEDLKIKKAIAARTAQDLQKRQLAKQIAQSASTGPRNSADDEVEERRKRYQAATFRIEAQKQKDADDLRKKTAARKIAPLQSNKPGRKPQSPQPPQPPQNPPPPQSPHPPKSPAKKKSILPDAEELKKRQLTAAVERFGRAYRVALAPPGPMTPAQQLRYDTAVKQRVDEERNRRRYVKSLALQENLTEDVFVQLMYGYKDLNDYIEKFNYDDIIRKTMAYTVAPSPPSGLPGESPPAGTLRPPNVNPDPIPFDFPAGGGSRGENQFRDFCIEMQNAVREGLQTRAAVDGITVWQAAHRRGWWSLQAMTNHWLHTLSLWDCPDAKLEINPTLDSSEQGNAMDAARRRIYNANDWEAYLIYRNNRGPVETKPVLSNDGYVVHAV